MRPKDSNQLAQADRGHIDRADAGLGAASHAEANHPRQAVEPSRRKRRSRWTTTIERAQLPPKAKAPSIPRHGSVGEGGHLA